MVRIKTWVIEKLGAYVGRILKGEKLADMPVQQATKTRLVYQTQNSKSAWAYCSSRLGRTCRRDDRIKGHVCSRALLGPPPMSALRPKCVAWRLSHRAKLMSTGPL